MFKLWGQTSPLPVHAVLSARCIGQVASIFISRPFLSEERHQQNVSFNGSFTQIAYNHVNHIHWPYLIIGTSTVIFGFISLAVFTFSNTLTFMKREMSASTMKIRKYCFPCDSRINVKYQILYGLIIFFAYFFICAAEVSLNMGILPVAVEGNIHFTKQNASLLHSSHHIARTLGRMLIGPVAVLITIKISAVLCSLSAAVSLGLLAFLDTQNPLVYWIIVPLQSFFGSSSTPSMLSLSDRYIQVSGFLIMVSDFGNTAGAFTTVAANGFLLEYTRPIWVLVLAFIWACFVFICIVVVIILGRTVGDRFCLPKGQSDEADSLIASDQSD